MTIETRATHAGSGTDEPWYRRARRWTQLTFVEDDPLHFDREFWVEVMRSTRSNGACISAGGYMAFYPTQVPYHYKSRHLGDMDLFGMVNDDARRLGMDVMARVDPHAVHHDAAEAHPEWIARDEEGNPLEHWSFPDVWLTCPFSTYYSDFLIEVTREITREYDVDAVFANRWEGSDIISYSEGARRQYFDATGKSLPTGSDRRTPEWAEFVSWRSDYLSRTIVEWDRAVREINPKGNFIPNRGGKLTRDLNPELVKDMYPAFYVDKQGRAPREAIWAAGRVGKRARGMYPDRPVTLISSVGPENHTHRWKDSVASAAELEAWIVDGFVHDAKPWFTKFNASVPDRRWVEPITRAFDLHARAEDLYGDKTPAARVAIFDSVPPETSGSPLSVYIGEDAAEDGLYHSLVEARIPFEYVDADSATTERLGKYSVVMVPESAELSEEHVALLRRFVAAGGNLLVDSDAVNRVDGTDNGLADLIGIEVVAPTRRAVQNNYVAVMDPAHEIAAPFAPASRILGGTAIVPVRAAADTTVPFRFVPDFPDLPMEEVYPRDRARDPAIVLREHAGGGRTAYVSFNVASLFWETLQSDHGTLITHLVRWVLADDRPVTVTGDGLIDIGVRESAKGVTVSLVNLDNPNALRGQLRAHRPIGPQTVVFRVPDFVTTATIRTLTTPTGVASDIIAGHVEFTVPSIELLEVVDLTWE
ncbi:hypothetical protein JWS13_14865 [Rhodococcus pseudokoreensis]|uniref:GLMA-like second domain-containing protein n=1 Tax=Rhodococcus pseudokoreensis TaxID=2811421 RepID=A0A974ZTF6_9NOCA|nr:alpha-amylase family protein [Rhodococcus pseudokoreensis]QSE89816.1 hypothetical protein JWS13_14865 [Rhodococcus pseudokoreensis]